MRLLHIDLQPLAFGDAKRMAKDVERALVDIVAQFGARSTDEAVSFVAELKKSGRFQADVY
jgi:sulfite reductase (NADPH) flavoprotein alpha-component